MSTFNLQIPEVKVEGKPLGRHIHRNVKSLLYPADAAPAIRSVRHASSGLPLNQLKVGACTTNALVGVLNTEPHWKPGQKTLDESEAIGLYSAEQTLLGYGPYPPNDNGGSGLAACTVAKTAGLLSFYQHAIGIDQALKALVLRPVMTGVNWYTSFDSPSSAGLVEIRPGATVRGGHEFFADEIDLLNRLVWFWNSWGRPFGKGGRFCMTFATWDELLREQGDVTIPRTAGGWKA